MLKNLLGAVLIAALMIPGAAQAQAFLGDLTFGTPVIGTNAGYYSISLNAGDNVTVTGHRLSSFDMFSKALGPSATPGGGNLLGFGDDQLASTPGFGGGFGDPQYTFSAMTTGLYSVYVGRCCDLSTNISPSPGEALTYSIQATGSTAALAAPGPIAGAGLVPLIGLAGGWVALRRRRKTLSA